VIKFVIGAFAGAAALFAGLWGWLVWKTHYATTADTTTTEEE
jgi:hypothetical protein